ncbi:MAG: hypothetical protein ACOC8N_06490, partial [Spirochaetota bacterium]
MLSGASLAALLFLALIAGPLYAGEADGSFTFRFERSDYQELRLPPGQRFSVVLEGTSWYINRYDREHLTFNLRKVGTKSIEFVLTAGPPSTAYVLFSSVEGDLYLRLFVEEDAGEPADEEAGQRPGEGLGETGTGEEAGGEQEEGAEQAKEAEPSPAGRDDRPPRGEGIDRPAPEEPPGPAGERPPPEEPPGPAGERPPPEEPPRKPGGLYYLDEQGKAVEVPARTEETAFQRGVASLEAGLLDQARQQLSDYLVECRRCTRRVDALVALAEVHHRSGRSSDALDFLNRALASAEGERAVSIRLRMAE